MKISKQMREQLLAHCGELREDDLIDARDFHKQKRRPGKRVKKALQVARQVFQTLQLVLTETDDPLFEFVTLVHVEPAPDSRRMRVLVRIDQQIPKDKNPNEILAAVAAQQGRLRSEVARSINRKKTPQLVFEIAD